MGSSWASLIRAHFFPGITPRKPSPPNRCLHATHQGRLPIPRETGTQNGKLVPWGQRVNCNRDKNVFGGGRPGLGW